MISWRSKSFYENRFESDYSVTDRPIWVNACGVDKLYGLETDYTIARPQGRQDYQLIYLRSGYAAHLVNGREVLLKEHGLALYRPGEPQLYRYIKHEQNEAYWIHFSGSEIEPLLQRFGYDFKLKQLGADFYDFEAVVNEMLQYIDKKDYCELCPALFKVLLLRLSDRALNSAADEDHRLLLVRDEMDSSYNEEHPVGFYAEKAGYNERYFIRAFKNEFGLTPRKYINKLRIERAIHMLKETAMSVTTISKTVGFSDPYYFSRLFKQITGKSPSEYRR